MGREDGKFSHKIAKVAKVKKQMKNAEWGVSNQKSNEGLRRRGG